jgi:hypothetical protein
MWRRKDASVKVLRLSPHVDNRLLLPCRQLLRYTAPHNDFAALPHASMLMASRGRLQQVYHYGGVRETCRRRDNETGRNPSDPIARTAEGKVPLRRMLHDLFPLLADDSFRSPTATRNH